ncbi:hypothetical protein [Carboxylicivirga sp. N1Y90]|uniref:hypothetical protein n=1 Tax=Carboxylicivirga fragile TaxID=3417571 RepID=UPI003D32BBC6|nr:hypothetical protein [Marinilabiliaceae bacterium N1Y90]
MASIKELKKDINFLASELVTEAYIKEMLKDDVNSDQLAQILVKAMIYRNELIKRANHPDGKDNPKLVKAYYTKLRKDMMEQFMAISEETNKL